MEIEYTDARMYLTKEGAKMLLRKYKAGSKCTYNCEHRHPHVTNMLCNIRCCDTPGKDVRCISIE